MTGWSRTFLLAVSPRRFVKTAKNLLLWRRLTKDPRAAALWNQHFDPIEYRRRYPDVASANISPRLHFLLTGNEEYRSISKGFDTRHYLDRYPEVARSGVNALLHFALFGHSECRDPIKPEPLLEQTPPVVREIVRDAVTFINNQWLRDAPLLSVVIICFNYGRFVEQALRSVLNQTFQDIEVIVVEGGSNDSTSVPEVQRLESLSFPRTRFYYRGERHLAGDNRNFGIGHARGRYICCLDADDLLRAVYLESAVFLAEVLGYDIVTPSVQCFGDSDLKWRIPEASFPAIVFENQVASAALFRRSAWAHVGGFRDWGTGADYIYEDWDFWIRLLGHGFRSKSIQHMLILYRVHGGSLTQGSSLNMVTQSKLLQSTNSALIATAKTDQPRRHVLNPLANLSAVEDGKRGFLLALPFISVGGAEKLLRTLGERIVARGERLIVITTITLPDSVPDDSDSFEAITPHVYPLSTLFSDDSTRGDFLRYLIRRYSVETLLLAGCEFAYSLLPKLKREFPELAVLDQLFNDVGHIYNNRLYAADIDITVVPSQQLLDALVQRYSADPGSVHVIPHGIKLPVHLDAAAGALPAKADGKVVVAFFGRLSSEKAPDLFVEIAHALSADEKLFFVMTGEGPEREKVMAQIRHCGLEDRIYAPGFVDDVMPLMGSADIVVLPSRIDGMPLAVLEAQALGKPVVASRVGSLPRMIVDQKTGFICEIGDVPAFCDRVLRLAHDPALRTRMSSAARQLVASQFGADVMLQAYEGAFAAARKQPRSKIASGKS